MPAIIIDNLLNKQADISVINWDDLKDPDILRLLLDKAFESRTTNKYDMSRPMRMRNS